MDIVTLRYQLKIARGTTQTILDTTESSYTEANARDWALTLDQLIEDIEEVLS